MTSRYLGIMYANCRQYMHNNYSFTVSVHYFKIFTDGDDFSAPSPFEVIFPTGTVVGDTFCVPCFIINDTNLEGDHSFEVRIQGVAPTMTDITVDPTRITVDPRDATVEITDDEGE